MGKSRLEAFLPAAILVLFAGPALGQTPTSGDRTEWSLAAGYGFSVHINHGRSNERLVLIEPAFGYMLSKRLEYIAEAHAAVYFSPGGYALGWLPLGGRFYFGSGGVKPYVSIGAGFGWTDLTRLIEIDRRFNFLLQGSLGVRGKISEKQSWSFEARLDHISNAGTALPNLGLNSVVLLGGWRFR